MKIHTSLLLCAALGLMASCNLDNQLNCEGLEQTMQELAIKMKNKPNISKVANQHLRRRKKPNWDAHCKDHPETALTNAVRVKHSNYINFLLEKGANVNEPNEHGLTPLMVAITEKHVGMCNLLLEKGANVNGANQEGVTPLMIAIAKSNLRIVNLLLEYQPSPAVNERHKGLEKVDVNRRAKDNSTAVFRAAKDWNSEILKKLIKEGAEVNVTDSKGNTPLTIAVTEMPCNALILIDKALKKNTSTEKEHLNKALGVIMKNLSEYYWANDPFYIAASIRSLREAGFCINGEENEYWKKALLQVASKSSYRDVLKELLIIAIPPQKRTQPGDKSCYYSYEPLEEQIQTILRDEHTSQPAREEIRATYRCVFGIRLHVSGDPIPGKTLCIPGTAGTMKTPGHY